MTLIKSISGIRGTIGGIPGENLTPADIVECTAAYAMIILENGGRKVVVGRDGRISGRMVNNIVCNTLIAMGLKVIDYGLSTTPAIEMCVCREKADAGIIITASHNPSHWNALKFLDKNGEFISAETGTRIIDNIENKNLRFAGIKDQGK